jgi:GTP:adenosylcobinamide-phosphate guanylyltransferase
VSASGRRFAALILAGSRGPDDPVARAAGVTHKALAPVAGEPMLLRVIRTLRDSRSIGGLAVCIDQVAFAELDRSGPAELLADVRLVAPDQTPSASVQRALDQLKDELPLLITTADNALLSPEMVEHFCTAAPADADLAVAVASETTIRRAYPESIRTYYRFAGEGYSGCNLFLARTSAAMKVAAFWSEVERHRKRPWRLVAAIGPLVLLRFLLGMLSLDAACRRLSAIVGATVRMVEMPFAEAAIDIDKPADLALTEQILSRRTR